MATSNSSNSNPETGSMGVQPSSPSGIDQALAAHHWVASAQTGG